MMLAEQCMVSVIVAAYNATQHLAACLDSVLAQTMTDWEVIVVDDRSTDTTAAMVRAYTARDGRIKLRQTPQNGGPSLARNTGIASASGVWVAILDADDCYRPERLQRMVEYGVSAESDVVSDNPLLVTLDDPQGSAMFTAAPMRTAHRVNLEEFILGNIGKRDEPRVGYGFMKPMIRTSFISEQHIEYNESMKFSEDFVFYITCLRCGARWDYVPEAMYLYTVRSGSLSESAGWHSRHLKPLFDFSRELVQSREIQSDVGSKRAATLHYEKVRRWYCYRAFVDALKVRQFGAAASVVYRTPDAMGGMVAEAIVQAPALVRKLLHKLPGFGKAVRGSAR